MGVGGRGGRGPPSSSLVMVTVLVADPPCRYGSPELAYESVALKFSSPSS